MLIYPLGVIAIPLQIISGDANARFLVDAQPAKLAAIEGIFKTEQDAPLSSGGFDVFIELRHMLGILLSPIVQSAIMIIGFLQGRFCIWLSKKKMPGIL